jgi:LacI family transcriptional regulator
MASKQITMRQIAQRAGVSQPVVSAVLNENFKVIKVSDQTRQRVLDVVKECGYYRNATGMALSTRRTGHIGLILSDVVVGGLGDPSFSQVETGVEAACRRRGYGMSVSLYNLSNLDDFVFPERVGQRSVDGVVLTGYVEAFVVQRFLDFGIPCVSVGDNLEVADMIPTISGDLVGGLKDMVPKMFELGHRRILYCHQPTRRGRETGDQVIAWMRKDRRFDAMTIDLTAVAKETDRFEDGSELMRRWLEHPEGERPTIVVASYQILAGFAAEMAGRGLRCPEDVGLVSTCDVEFLQYIYPQMSAIRYELARCGARCVDMLVDHMEKGEPLTAAMSGAEPGAFVQRASVGVASKRS